MRSRETNANVAARELGLCILTIPLLVLLPILLLLEAIDTDVFLAIGALWLLIALILILGPDTITEVSFGRASIKRDVRAAQDARKEVEQIRDGLTELLKLSIENNYILISGSELARGGHPSVTRVERNLNRLTDLLGLPPEEVSAWQEKMRGVMRATRDN